MKNESPILKMPFTTVFLRKLIVGLGLAALFTWLALRPQPGSDDRLVDREMIVMGTIVSVSVYLEPGQDRAAAEKTLQSLEGYLRDYEKTWSAWADGPLGQMNKTLAQGQAASIPEPMRPLFDRAAQLSALSGGRFDVRVGGLVKLWGFDDEMHFRKSPPPAADVAASVAALDAAPPLSTGETEYGPASGIQLDFGAIAKGDATDLALAQLHAAGYGNAIVNAGGNLRASGRHGERPWRIGIRHPRPDATHRMLATLDLDDDEAVITSGDYERYFEFQGTRYHHILDPHTGDPARGFESVTVVADNGALADAASTALFVAGPKDWREVARKLSIDRVLVVLSDGSVIETQALAKTLKLADGIHAETVP